MNIRPDQDRAVVECLHRLNGSMTDFRSIVSHLPTVNVTLPEAGVSMTAERALACELLDRWNQTHSDHGPTVSDIARTLGLEQSTASRLITGLVKDGLAERSPNPADRRSVVLNLSSTGQQVLQEIRTYRDQVTAEIFHDWTDEELAVAADVLDRISHCVVERGPEATEKLADELPPASK